MKSVNYFLLLILNLNLASTFCAEVSTGSRAAESFDDKATSELFEILDSEKGCTEEDIEQVKKLIDMKANPNTKNRDQETILHQAFGLGTEFMDFLLKNKADPAETDLVNATPLHVICDYLRIYNIEYIFCISNKLIDANPKILNIKDFNNEAVIQLVDLLPEFSNPIRSIIFQYISEESNSPIEILAKMSCSKNCLILAILFMLRNKLTDIEIKELTKLQIDKLNLAVQFNYVNYSDCARLCDENRNTFENITNDEERFQFVSQLYSKWV